MIDNITNTLNSMTSLNVALTLFIPSVAGIAAQIATWLPPPKEPGGYATTHKVINWLGRNVKHAENKQ